jgi:homoserine kinase
MAVYTDVSDEELESFITSYDIGALTSFKGIAEGVENSNYLLHTETGPYILTLYEKRVAREDLPYFLALMEHLASRGITCPLPVHDRAGRNLKELAGRPSSPSSRDYGCEGRASSIAQASVGHSRVFMSPAQISPYTGQTAYRCRDGARYSARSARAPMR